MALMGGDRTENIRQNLNNSDQNNIDVEEHTEENYFAQINAEIANIYPQYILIATTNEYDKTKIEEELLKNKEINLEGVNYNIDGNEFIVISRFKINDINKEKEILENITQIEYFLTTEFYKNATIYLPDEEIELISDKNISKTYYFTTGRAEAIIGIETQIEDNVNGQLQVIFKKDTPTTILFLETQNITAQPQLLFDDINLEIDHFEESYLYIFKKEIENQIDENTIKKALDKNIEISFNDIKKIKLNINNKNIEDVNKFIIKQEENENNTEKYIIDENILEITLNDLNINKYNEIIEKLKLENITEILEKPYTKIEIIINDSEIEENKQKLINLGIKLEKIKKKGIFNISEITIKEITYNYKDQFTEAWLDYPEDINKIKFNLNLQAYVSRTEIILAQLGKIEK